MNMFRIWPLRPIVHFSGGTLTSSIAKCLWKLPYPTSWTCENGFVHATLQVNLQDIPSSIWLPDILILLFKFSGCRWHHWDINRWFIGPHNFPLGSSKCPSPSCLRCTELKLINTHLGCFNLSFATSLCLMSCNWSQNSMYGLWCLQSQDQASWVLKHGCRILTCILWYQ